MKKNAILFLLIFFGLIYGGWERIYFDHPNYNYTKVQFIDPQYGWVLIGYQNMSNPSGILHSNDSGKTWELTEYNGLSSRLRLRDLCFVDKNIGFVAGFDYPDTKTIGFVYKTIDGGSNWNLVFSDTSLSGVSKIVFPTPSIGYFFARQQNNGQPQVMGKTTDGGNNWIIEEIADSNPIDLVTDVFFINADTGWVVGTQRIGGLSVFLKTVDGGKSWVSKRYREESLNRYIADEIRTVFFSNSQVGHIASTRGVIYYTKNGGDDWEFVGQSGSDIPVTGMHFANDSVGWAIGSTNRSMYFFKDSLNGLDRIDYWLYSVINIDPNTSFYHGNSLNSMCFIGNYGWIVGSDVNGGLIYRTTNYGGLLSSNSVNFGQRQKSHPSYFNMRLSPIKNGMSNINYTINTESTLSISVYNLKGKKVAFQPKRLHAAGEHSFTFKAPKGFYIAETKIQDKLGMGEKRFSERILVK